MDGTNTDAQPPYDGNQVSEPPPTAGSSVDSRVPVRVDNIHQTVDNGGGNPYQSTGPAHANQIPPYSPMPPSMTSEAPAPLSNGASPMATASHAATPPNTTSIPLAPKDGKSAAQPDFPTPLPSQAQAHGAPVRQYLNENVAPYLLDVSKHLAAHRPQRPLEFIAEYFTEKSRQIEGTK